MESLERSVYATAAYYSALRWPLTLAELTEHLIPPTRFGGTSITPSIGDIAPVLDRLIASGVVMTGDGLAWTAGALNDSVRERVRRHNANAHAWKRMLPSARFLQVVPYVRMVAASGSLALGSTGPQSDWDVFVVVQAGRLYTARTFLMLVAALMGRLRTKRHRTAPDMFCFNHIVTTGGLAIRHRSIFVAHALAWLVPIYDPQRYAARLRDANQWTADTIIRPGDLSFERRALRESRVLALIRRCAEVIFDTFVGDALEYVLRVWQQRRIQRDPATRAPGGRVVADDRELEFHPRSFESTVLARYRVLLARVGMERYAERDSGLTKK
ncbi:MAG: hypothetical protein IT406_04020 [Candidatus Yanofskybacteria bacterium]|nr:hypothetical protein [Candidatus Yanofskybacteria bacterium]